jgi:hypothetical protein
MSPGLFAIDHALFVHRFCRYLGWIAQGGPLLSLEQFLTSQNIDRKALAAIRKRVFVVGRFNQRRINDPEVFLFTDKKEKDENNPEGLTKAYMENFDGIGRLDYKHFVRLLQPAISEKIVGKINKEGGFPQVVQMIPRCDKDLESAYVVDHTNYFLDAAVRSSEQSEFVGKQDTSWLIDDKDQPGRTIFKQIRENLATLCTFQVRNHEIIEVVSLVLSKCAGEGGMPIYSDGGALPRGFEARFFDFLYSDDPNVDFEEFAKEIDWSGGQWEDIAIPGSFARKTFNMVMGALRDFFIGTVGDSTNLSFKQTPLNLIIREATPQELKSKFREAREAFSSLRQILRSKVLLSMILEWLIDGYYQIPDVDPSAKEDKRNKAVRDAIYKRWNQNGNNLAPPVSRPSMEARRELREMLERDFDLILRAIVSKTKDLDGETLEIRKNAEAINSGKDISDPRARVVAEMLGNPGILETLKKVSGVKLEDPSTHKQFIEAAKLVIADVVLPIWFQNPLATRMDLLEWLEGDLKKSYLMAIFYADASERAIREIAQKNLTAFTDCVDKETKEINGAEGVVSSLVQDFLGVLASPELSYRLEEAMKTLAEMFSVFRFAGDSGGRIGDTVPLVSSEAIEESPEEVVLTASPTADKVKGLLASGVDQVSLLMAASQSSTDSADSGTETEEASDTDESEGDGTTSSSGEEDASSAKAPKPWEPKTDLEQGIAQIIEKAPAVAKESNPEPTSEEILDTARKLAQEDEDLGKLISDTMIRYQHVLQEIYGKYAKKKDEKPEFRAVVERFALTQVMLLVEKQLGLGKMGSNLYSLLVDMIQYVDPETLDLSGFMRERSLTHYFDDGDLEGTGLKGLRTQLEIQRLKSLNNIVRFVSELHGISYLMNKAAEIDGTEVIVINADAVEFKNWLIRDNLNDNCKGRLHTRRLVIAEKKDPKTPDPAEKIFIPGLVCMSDSSFSARAEPENNQPANDVPISPGVLARWAG